MASTWVTWRKPAASSAAAAALAILLAAASAGTAAAKGWEPDDYVDAHNRARRAQHGADLPDVRWDGELAEYARGYARRREGDCDLRHSNGGGGYGENLFWGAWGGGWSAGDAVDSWADEGRYYDYSSNRCEAGHKCYLYKQVVWRGSVWIGCAHVQCRDHLGVFVTCNYRPKPDLDDRPY